MNELPALTAAEIIRGLERCGFVLRRSKGSHRRLVHRDDASRATTVAVHGNSTISKPLVLRILKQARLTVDEFRAVL
jgi:predicted RNA binding protein YcfA (HicA-like mRNA interferase family)